MTTPPEKPTLRLGGMALENGLLVHGPGHWAAAIRDEEGTVRVASGAKSALRATRSLEGVPLVRGVLKMAEMLLVLPNVRRELPGARLPFERPSLVAASAAGAIVTAGARRSGRLSPAAVEALAGTFALLPALVALRSKNLAAYHGAEHKTIGAYETGLAPEETPKEHDRCGSHLVGPLMAASALANIAVSRLPRRHQGPARAAASLAAVGVAVETFAWMNRHAGHPAARVLSRPGHELQRFLGTREPAPDQLEVARAALDRLLAAEGATSS
jgi:uncharacterized protein YqhQ